MARKKEQKNLLTEDQMQAAIILAELGLKEHYPFKHRVTMALAYSGAKECTLIVDEETAKALIITSCYELFGRSDFRTNCILVSLGIAEGYTTADSGTVRRRRFAEHTGQTEAKIRKAYQEYLKELALHWSRAINANMDKNRYVEEALEDARRRNILVKDEFGNKLQLPTLG